MQQRREPNRCEGKVVEVISWLADSNLHFTRPGLCN
jgi:hypothetical protein